MIGGFAYQGPWPLLVGRRWPAADWVCSPAWLKPLARPRLAHCQRVAAEPFPPLREDRPHG